MRPKVYVTFNLPPPGEELLRESCDLIVHQGEAPPTRDEVIRNLQGADALLCILTTRIDRDVIAAGDRLRIVSTMSVGFEHIDVAAATERGIYVGYTPGVLTDATADLAFSLLMAAARRIAEADRFVRSGSWKQWSPTLLLGRSIAGKTLGIVGFGRIGQAVAQRARGFNMRILYADEARRSPDEERQLSVEHRPLDALIRESDFVTLHVPMNDGTHHLIDEARLKAMRRSAILVNTSRGGVVDQQALAAALKEGWIAAAGIDVYEQEPIAPDDPLLALDNVVLLPHIGSATHETRGQMAEIAARNILNVLAGKKPLHAVNEPASPR
jgi:glyoxylate reductase